MRSARPARAARPPPASRPARARAPQEHYPWFLPTYRSYPYDIQRVDVLRYFILHHHGGIYIDLDMGCLKKLDWMRHANFTAPMTNPLGISNDVMAAAPGAPYLEHATRRLAHWNKWLVRARCCWRGAGQLGVAAAGSCCRCWRAGCAGCCC